MGKLLLTIICILTLYIGVVEAQVTPGTTSSKTLDGIGNKITSTTSGADRGLDINCLNCAAAGLTQDINVVELLGVAPGATNPFPQQLSTGVAFYDARDRNWTLSSGTDSVSAVQSGVWNIGTLTSITNPVAVTGTFFQATQPVSGTFWQATQPVSGSLGRSWVLASGTDSIDAVQSGTWNIGTVTAVTSITNPVAVTGTFFQATQPVSVASLPLPLGAATEATLGTASGTLTNIDNALSTTNSELSSIDAWASNLDVLLSTRSSEATLLTMLTEAAFQARINVFGQNTMANSTPVVLPSDQAAIPVTVLSTVASANDDGTCPSGSASFTVLASNASRTWAAIWASPANTDDVYVKLGTTATSSDARIAPGQTINFTSGRIYTGRIDALPASGTQAMCVMELN